MHYTHRSPHRRNWLLHLPILLALLLALILAACGTPAPEIPDTLPSQPQEQAAPAEQQAAVPANPDSRYQEAPMLAERVAAGELPQVDERLPAEPLVIRVRSELGETPGQYGGTLTTMGLTPNRDAFGAEWSGAHFWYPETVATWDLADRKHTPNIADSWELADDFMSITFHLREGVRWSDGELLTTEDVEFWWNNIMLNENLTPQIPAQFAPGGTPQTVVIVDDYTFRFEYAVPYPAAADGLSRTELAIVPWAPKHYLTKWHIDFNPDANAVATEEGFGDWWEAFLAHRDFRDWGGEVPVLAPWIIGPPDSAGNVIAERNPYYWKVDEQGRQLPYIDYYERILVGSREILEAKAVAGEYNFGGAWADLQNYPLLAENAESAGYTLRLYPGRNWAGSVSWAWNYTSKDPVLREIFNDLRFRRAMAHAINRSEFNEVFNLGLTEPRQPAPPPDWSLSDPAWGQNYIEYDVELANQLLDEMGLEWDANQEWRLRPDGERLTINTEIGQEGQRTGEWEFIVQYWAKVGVEVNYKQVDHELYAQHLLANDLDVGTWGAGGPSEQVAHGSFPIRLAPPWHWRDCCALAGIPWYDWWASDGAQGEEPPDQIKELYAILDEWFAEPMGSERYLELGRQLVQINDENIWWNGVTGPAPGIGAAINVSAVSNKVHNLRDPEANGGWWVPEMLWIEP